MSIQLQFQFDQQKLRITWSTLGHTDQQELIQGLGEMFFNFMRTKKKEVIEDESNSQGQNQ